MVVYTVTSVESFAIMKGWVDELKSVGPANIRIVIAANKCDRHTERQVSSAEALEYAREMNAQL